MLDRVQHQALGIDQHIALLTFDLLACVEPVRIDAGLPFSALLTFWLSMMAAVGLASQPACSRQARSGAWWMRSNVPLPSHSPRPSCGVLCGGRSFGTARYWQPVLSTYINPLTTSRRSTVRQRPPRLLGGMQGSITATRHPSRRWDSAACSGHTGRGSRPSTFPYLVNHVRI